MLRLFGNNITNNNPMTLVETPTSNLAGGNANAYASSDGSLAAIPTTPLSTCDLCDASMSVFHCSHPACSSHPFLCEECCAFVHNLPKHHTHRPVLVGAGDVSPTHPSKPKYRPWREFAIAFAFFQSGVWVMTFAMNFVHMRMPDPKKYPPLPDLIHDFIPKLGWDWMAEPLFYADSFLCLGAGIYFFRWNVLYKLMRFLCAWGAAWHFRTLFLLSTGLPPTPDYYCREDYPNYPADFPHPVNGIWRNTFIGIISFGDANIHCGDLLFSGHATLLTLDFLVFWSYFRHKPWLFALATAVTFMAYFVVIVERHHYTVDVVCAAVVSTFMWYVHPEHLPWYLTWASRRNPMPPPPASRFAMMEL